MPAQSEDQSAGDQQLEALEQIQQKRIKLLKKKCYDGFELAKTS
jgi:hypothetical protein